MARKQPIKPITFRLHPEGSFLFCEVNIWPTKRAMHANTEARPKNYAACCGGRESYVVPPKGSGRRMRRTGLFAEANFHRKELGIEVVSHEMTHAAFAFADRRKLNLNAAISEARWNESKNTMDQDGPEERFCYALGQMCRQFTQKCYDLGLYQDVVTAKT